MTREKYEAQQKEAAAKARSGFAPSEASDKELKAHANDKGFSFAPMTIKKSTKQQSPDIMGNAYMAPSPFAIKSSTAGTTVKGLQPATSSAMPATNYLGSGPNPAAVNNSLITFKKKSKI